jgi:hypothetical protein
MCCGRSFCAVNLGDSVEQDMRFTYSAAVVSYILDDWSGFDKCVKLCVVFDSSLSQRFGVQEYIEFRELRRSVWSRAERRSTRYLSELFSVCRCL